MEYYNNTSNGTSKGINKENIASQEYNQELNKIRSILVGSSKGYTVTEIARKIKINRNSVAKYLDILVTAGVAEMKMVGSAKLFTLSKRMSITSIINISSDYILLLDEDSNVTYANENMLKFEGKSLDEIVGKQVNTLELVRSAGSNISQLFKESLQGKEVSTDIEFTANNTTIVFRAKFVPGILENSRKGLIVIMSKKDEFLHSPQNNKTEKNIILGKKNEELIVDNSIISCPPKKNAADNTQGKKFWDYMAIAPEGIWAVDEKINTTFINKTMAEMLGYSVDEMIGQPFFNYLDETCIEHAKKTFEIHHKEHAIRRKKGVRFIRKDKTKIDTIVASTPFFDEAGVFTGALTIISDITEWNKTEKNHRENEEYSRAIIAASPNGMIIFDSTGRIRMTNRQTVRYFGYSDSKELENENIFNFISPDDFKKCHTFLHNPNKNENVTTIECSFIKKDSSEFNADLMISLFGEMSRKENLFIGVITDVTERRKAEASIRKSERMYRSLVEGISHIIFTLDLKGKITYISPVIQQILGYLPSELIGKHFYVLTPSDARQTISMKLAGAQSGRSAPFDIQAIDKSGNQRWVRIIVGAQKEDGKAIGFSGLIGDINNWKLAEDAFAQCELKYKAVVEDQTDLICRFSPDLKIRFINPSFCRFFDQKEENILEKSVTDYIPTLSNQVFLELINQLNKDRPVRILEMDFISPSGIQYSYHTSVHCIFNSSGEKAEYQIICRDITELKTYFERSQKLLQNLQLHEAELNVQNEELKRLQKVAQFSERRYRDLYDEVPAGYLILDTNGRIIEINQTGAQLLGDMKNQLLMQSFSDYISQDCRSAFSKFLKTVFSVQKRQMCNITVSSYSTPATNVLLIGKLIEGQSGKPAQCRAVLIDFPDSGTIDQKQESFEGVDKDLTGDATIKCTAYGIINDWNRAAERVFGYSKEDIMGKPISLLVLPGNTHELSPLLEGIFKGENVDPYETSSIKKNGSIITVTFTASPLKNSAGNVTDALILVRENIHKSTDKTPRLENPSRFVDPSLVMTR